jgi:hypothetical protein
MELLQSSQGEKKGAMADKGAAGIVYRKVEAGYSMPADGIVIAAKRNFAATSGSSA